jgi:hypothetical protein
MRLAGRQREATSKGLFNQKKGIRQQQQRLTTLGIGSLEPHSSARSVLSSD